MSPLRVCAAGLALLALFTTATTARSDTVAWKDPVNGNWTDGSKWSTGQVPAAGDDVVIDAGPGSYTVTLNVLASVGSLTLGATSGASMQTLGVVAGGTLSPTSASTVHAKGTLHLSGGTLGGAGALSVAGTLQWVAGTITGSGGLSVNGTLNIAVQNFANVVLDGRTLTNAGNAIWSSGAFDGNIVLRNNAVLANTGTLEIQTDRVLDLGDPSMAQFTNSGTVRKTAGLGTATIDVTFVNSGTVEPSSGTMALSRASTIGGTVTASAVLVFSAGNHTLNGVTFGGTGTTRVAGATVNTTGAGATVADGGTLQLSGGTLGGAGPLTVDGTLNWTLGTITGGGALTINGALSIAVQNFADVVLDGRTLTNAGNAIWSSGAFDGNIVLRNNAVLANTGTLEIQTDRVLDLGDPSMAQFTNSGTVRKTAGLGTATIDVHFVSTGTVELSSGTLAMTRTSNFGGTVAASTTLRFSSGTHVFDGLTIAGSGTTQVNGATVNTVGAGATVAPGATLQLASGNLGGAGPLTVNGTLSWTNGTVLGTGALTINGILALAIQSSVDVALDGRLLTIAGNATWTSGAFEGDIILRNNAVIANTGTFDIQSNRTLDLGDATVPQFINSGILRKTGGTGTTTIDVTFSTTGTVSGESGTINFTRGFTQTAGNTVLSGGGRVATNSTLNVLGGSISGSGTIGGNVSSGGQTSPGLSPGTLSITGNYAQSAGSSLRIELGGSNPGIGFDQVQLSGTNAIATLSGALIVELLGAFVPAVDDSFVILNAPNGSVAGNFTSTQFPSVPGVIFQVVVGAKSVVVNALQAPTPTATSTPTFTPTSTSLPTASPTATGTNTRTPTSTITATATTTRTSTETATRTPTATATLSSTPTATASRTTTNTSTSTATHSPTPTATETRTATATTSATGTPTPTATQTASSTPTETRTSTPSVTPTPIPTRTETLTPTFTATSTVTLTETPTQTETPSHPPTSTRSFTAAASATGTPSETPTASHSRTPSATSTATSTETEPPPATATETPKATATVTPTVPVPTSSATPTPTATRVPLPGDANCDQRVTSADLPALLELIATGVPDPCGQADANGDGMVSAADVDPTIEAIFGLSRNGARRWR